MEDELASMAAILGASWAGAKAMTATSGPGFTLMMENIGLGVMTETPCVVVDVQRGGPSTGLPTLASQADMMQAKWGSHGDYEPIAYAPSSPQEMFDLTIKAFNPAERYRLPVFVMVDEMRRPHDRARRSSRPPARSRSSTGGAAYGARRATAGCPTPRAKTWCPRWRAPATATASTSPA